jgi:TPR repeat protein
VAWCYHRGEGVAADVAESEAWFQRAFEGGSQRGLLEYGSLNWWRGDLDKCEAIFSVGAANGWAPAQYWLAKVRVRKSRTRATLWEVRPLLEGAIANGSPAAKWFLGYYIGRGWYGLRAIPSGLKLLWQFGSETRQVLDAISAADKGGASAQYRLGWIYAFGGSVAHNDRKAVELFDQSAAQGNANAMMAKGWMYANGRGVAQDSLQAYVWSTLAASRISEADAEERKVAIENRDWARSCLNRAEAARARRMVKKETIRLG